MSRLAAALVVGVAVLAAACGKDSASAAAPPQAPAPDPQGTPTAGPPQPTPQPSPGAPGPQPSPSPSPAPSPDPGASPTTATPAPGTPTIRWAVAAPGVFWVGMDDAGARWSAAVVRSRGALRLEKRDRGGALLWSGEWGFQGDYRFSAAVTPGGEALFAASSSCDGEPACADTLLLPGGAAPVRGSAVVRLGTGGEVRWVRRLSGVLAGADADGGAALAGSHPAGSASYLAVKLDASGNTRWTREITSLVSLRLDRTGDLLAVGCYQDDRALLDGIPCQRGVTAARLAADGTTLWSTGGLAGYWPAIDTTADGTGYAVTRAFTLTALAPDGAVRWSRTIGESPRFGNQRGDPVAVAAAANGPVAVAGYTVHPAPGRLTPAVILGFDAAGSPTFVDEAPFDQPSAMVYGADGELLVAVPGGGVDAPGGRVDGAVVIELTP